MALLNSTFRVLANFSGLEVRRLASLAVRLYFSFVNSKTDREIWLSLFDEVISDMVEAAGYNNEDEWAAAEGAIDQSGLRTRCIIALNTIKKVSLERDPDIAQRVLKQHFGT